MSVILIDVVIIIRMCSILLLIFKTVLNSLGYILECQNKDKIISFVFKSFCYRMLF